VKLDFEWVGVILVAIGGLATVNLFVTRAVIHQEFEKFQAQFRPIRECELLHQIVDLRLTAGEKTGGS